MSTQRGPIRAALLVDTPNLYYTTKRAFGPAARPDYSAIYELGRQFGHVRAIAFVNPGASEAFIAALHAMGYEIERPVADDVDYALIAKAVSLSGRSIS